MKTTTKAILLTTLLLPLALAGLAGAAPAGVGAKPLASASAQCGPTYAHASADGLTSASASASVVGQTSGSASAGIGHVEAHAYGTGIGSSASASASTVIPGVASWSASASCNFPGRQTSAPALDGIACKDTDDSAALNGDVFYSGQLAFDPSTEQSWFVGTRSTDQAAQPFAFPATVGVLTFERGTVGSVAPQNLVFTGIGLDSKFVRDIDGVACESVAF